MKIYYIILFIFVIYFLKIKINSLQYSLEELTDVKKKYLNLIIDKSKINLTKFGINDESLLKNILILSKYMPIEIINYSNIYDDNNMELIITREYLITNQKYLFISGFNYEYIIFATYMNITKITDLNKVNYIKIGVNNNDKSILLIFLKLINITNYKLVVDSNNNIIQKFINEEINLLFKICDKMCIYLKQIYNSKKHINILNLNISSDLLSKYINPIYKRKVPKYLYQYNHNNTMIDTFSLRTIVVSNKVDDKKINLFLEIINYYNRDIIDEYRSTSNDSNYINDFLKDMSFNLLNIQYHPVALKYYQKKKLVILKS